MTTALRGAITAITLAAMLAAGCDSRGASTSAPTTAESLGQSAPPPATRLRVTYYPHGSASTARRQWTLTCSPTGGNHPRRAQACAELAAHPHALAAARRPCRLLAVRGAPQTLVTGAHRGATVRRLFRPACDAEWTSLHALLRGR